MSIWARLRFLIGILLVFAVIALLVLYLNAMLSTVHATEASLGADTTTIGVDYPGQVSAQNVAIGQQVAKGQVMFTVTSPSLTSDIANHTVPMSALPFKLDKSGDIPVTAPSSGTVQRIDYQAGSYVPGGAVMAAIFNANSLYISGKFNLSPPDYARLQNGEVMDVTFPDDSTAMATVYNVTLEQDGSSVITVVNARLPKNYKPRSDFSIGTPVQASLRLTKATWWDDLSRAARKVFSPKTE